MIGDDMGGNQLPKRSGEWPLEIIQRRHEMRSTLMTSNRPLEDWGKLVGDAPSVTAMLDRLLENSEVIPVTGKSDRRWGPEMRVRELGGANWKTPANARGGTNGKPARGAPGIAVPRSAPSNHHSFSWQSAGWFWG
ncbi:MAG: ATP-binding protein, partial [Planctomycetaceae bacterium]